ncbi:MAG: hypothetical protein H6702_21040 [Myxococcales bacterium]|nr:hypothetical protein [Myxococcales bacterium]
MFVQRDLLMRQIEAFARALAEAAQGGGQLDAVDEAELSRSAGLSLDVAAHLPLATVAGLVGDDPKRLLALGLGLAARARQGQGSAAAAAGLIDRALARDPTLADADVHAARAALP